MTVAVWGLNGEYLNLPFGGRAKETEEALEKACLNRLGTLRSAQDKPVIRSDNGLVFQSRRFREMCGDYGLPQEFVTPYTPEQNGMIERFFRSLKEECVWLLNFRSFEEARREISRWIHWYNEERPHQSLGYLSPKQFRLKQAALVACFQGSITFLKPQGRFRHLFKGEGSKALLEEIQADVDADWQKILDRCGEAWEA